MSFFQQNSHKFEISPNFQQPDDPFINLLNNNERVEHQAKRKRVESEVNGGMTEEGYVQFLKESIEKEALKRVNFSNLCNPSSKFHAPDEVK